MTYAVPVRAIALGLLIFASVPACASHVDVGFTSEGGVQSSSDAGDGSRFSQSSAGDAADARGAACTFTRVCSIGGACLPSQLVPAPWCTGSCADSIDVCDDECVDLSSDSNHCGRCSRQCTPPHACVMSDCTR